VTIESPTEYVDAASRRGYVRIGIDDSTRPRHPRL
jgi:hypothetical protein